MFKGDFVHFSDATCMWQIALLRFKEDARMRFISMEKGFPRFVLYLRRVHYFQPTSILSGSEKTLIKRSKDSEYIISNKPTFMERENAYQKVKRLGRYLSHEAKKSIRYMDNHYNTYNT